MGGTETRFYNFGSRVVEETNSTGAMQANYVYGGYVDEVLSMNRSGSSTDYYFHGDDQHNVMALRDDNGTIVEHYDYSDFGAPTIYNPGDGSTRTSSIASNPYQFNGRRYDTESSLYYYRTRYMDPNQGRFTTRDSIGIWGDPLNLGNGYTYVGNNPMTFVDPYGEEPVTIYVCFEVLSTGYDIGEVIFFTATGQWSAAAESLAWTASGIYLPGPGNAYRRGGKAAVGAVTEFGDDAKR